MEELFAAKTQKGLGQCARFRTDLFKYGLDVFSFFKYAR